MNRYHTSEKPSSPGDPKSDWPVEDAIQRSFLSFLQDELDVAVRNNEGVNKDFTEYYNMIHGIRESKPNDWESDIYMPEYLSRLLTQIGNFVAQYFGSTDFVECDIDSEDPKDIAEAKASKVLLNKLLNDKKTHYYHKVVRLLMYCFTCGYSIIKGEYRQKVEPVITYYKQTSELATDPETGEFLGDDGFPYQDPTVQRPKYNTVEEPVWKNNIIEDRPTFDVYPNQNVYMSPEYCYSLNDKEYIIFETEKTLDELRDEQEEMGYVNLDLLDEEEPEGPRGEKTYNRDGNIEEQPKPVSKTFFIYERWGKCWYVVGKDGAVGPGIDSSGNWLEDAQLGECIITYAKERATDNLRHVIRFKVSPHSKRPMVRFLCYIDMVKDCGFGDGEINRELQKAINDNYNLMNYRTRLSITPAFKGKKFSGIPDKIKISPESVIFMENIDSDLKELTIQDNIQGGVIHQNLLSSRMDYCMATAPQTMGMSPERGETATSANIINQRANIRLGMKSMNQEFVGFTELYDMLLTMVNDFMLPETLQGILGQAAYDYNPKREDKFRPVSQALETEESKQFKIKTWQGVLGMVAPIQNPKTPMVTNYIIGQILETMGGQFKHFKKFMLEDNPEAVAIYQLATGGQASVPAAPNPMAPPSNQMGIPQGQAQQQTRQAAPNQIPRQTGPMPMAGIRR